MGVGLFAQVLGGPIFGILGAVAGAAAGHIIVRHEAAQGGMARLR
jgi:hypothetical protein